MKLFATQKAMRDIPTPLQAAGIFVGVALLLGLGTACWGPVYTPPKPPPPPAIQSVRFRHLKPALTIQTWHAIAVTFASDDREVIFANPYYLYTQPTYPENISHQTELSRLGNPSALSSAPSGALVVGFDNGTLRSAPSPDLKLLALVGSMASRVECVAITPNSAYVAAADRDTVRMWKVPEGREVFSLPDTSGVKSLSFSPDGMLVVAMENRTLKVVDIKGQHILNLTKENGILSAVFSPDGKRIAFSKRGGGLSVVDLQGRSVFESVESAWGTILHVIFNKEGTHLLAASDSGLVLDIDLARQLKTEGFAAHRGAVIAIAVSPSGRLIATAGNDDQIRIWDFQ